MAEAAFLEDDDEVVPASKRAARKGAAARRSILRDEDEADHEHDVPPLRRSQRVRVRESMQENVDFAPPPADIDQENEHLQQATLLSLSDGGGRSSTGWGGGGSNSTAAGEGSSRSRRAAEALHNASTAHTLTQLGCQNTARRGSTQRHSCRWCILAGA